ncbi:MAG: alpha/beta hydrolase [Chlamydiae bacterium]|nr:alpha/beta hydrolase [Chlamydiota bacterium]MBI3277048.1 alpha/beta hydrolase [Chlamydiota bacterium]
MKKFKSYIFKHRWTLEWALRLFGGRQILADYFISRIISIGVPYVDATDVFNKIRSLEDWVKLWYRLGLRREFLAKEAESKACFQTAAASWMMARALFQVAQFPFYGQTDLKEKVYKRCANAYAKAAPYLHPPAQRIEIPFHSISLPGYLRLPMTGSSERCLVIFGGIDGVKEEMHYYGDYFVHRGFSVLYFDAPGLGESWTKVKMDPNYTFLGEAIHKFLENNSQIKFKKIGLLGVSLGGNMALHIAASKWPVHSCVSISAPFCPKKYFHHLVFLVQKAAHHIVGDKTLLDLFMDKISLEGVICNIGCPLLVIGGARDTILPGEEALKIYQEATGVKKLLYYPDATHGCPEKTIEMFWKIEQWFNETMK